MDFKKKSKRGTKRTVLKATDGNISTSITQKIMNQQGRKETMTIYTLAQVIAIKDRGDYEKQVEDIKKKIKTGSITKDADNRIKRFLNKIEENKKK